MANTKVSKTFMIISECEFVLSEKNYSKARTWFSAELEVRDFNAHCLFATMLFTGLAIFCLDWHLFLVYIYTLTQLVSSLGKCEVF